jgi:hypothetical protein
MTHMTGFEQPQHAARAVADRRSRSSRAALDGILDRSDGSADMLGTLSRTTSAVSPMLWAQHDSVRSARARLARRGEIATIAGAFVTLGLVVLLCTMAAPVGEQAIRIVVAAMTLGMFRLAVVRGKRLLDAQVCAQITVSLALLAGSASTEALASWDLAMLFLGWSAIGFRWLQMVRARQLDVADVELMLTVRNRSTETARTEMHRRVAAAI